MLELIIMMTRQLAKTIAKVVDKLKDYQPEKIILFGSAARECSLNDDGDLDFFIIKKTRARFINRERQARRLLGNLRYQLPMDLVIYTPAEFAKAKAENRFFIEQVLKDGKVVYEKSN